MENFDISPSEIANLWAEQDKYIDSLESRLRESEKTSRREQSLMTKLIRKNQELYKVKAELAELKKSRASQHGVGEEGPVCSKSLAPAPALCQVTSCIPGKRPRKTGPLPTKWNDLDSRNKEIIIKEFNLPKNIKRVCKPCSTRLNRRIGVILAIQKFNRVRPTEEKSCEEAREEIQTSIFHSEATEESEPHRARPQLLLGGRHRHQHRQHSQH